jgi:hypothetical protein
MYLWSHTWYPSVRMRDSLSRMPTRVCPNGERTIMRSTAKASANPARTR